jgi:hypothetical protein
MSQPANRQVSQFTISELDAEITRYDSLLKQQEATTATIRNQLNLLRSELDRRARGALEPRLSDHALIRFMERALGFDVEAIKGRILTPERKAAIRAGATSISVDGVRLKVQDNVIVTVLDQSPEKRFARKIKSGKEAEDGPSLQEGLADYFEDYAQEVMR